MVMNLSSREPALISGWKSSGFSSRSSDLRATWFFRASFFFLNIISMNNPLFFENLND
jgi:hypothetical protein